MTAVSVFVLKERVHLVTDGAAYDCDGKMLALIQKVTLIPHLGCAVVVRGNTEVARWVAGLVMNTPSAANVEHFLSEGCRVEYASKVADDPAHWMFDAVVAGVRGGKPFAVLVSSHDRPEHSPFEPLAITAAWSSPPIELDEMKIILRNIQIFPVQAAGSLLDHQRESSEGIVDGYGQITTITHKGFETQLVRVWP